MEKVCPEGKKLNPLTNRCVNIKQPVIKVCPKGKEINPDTGRCRKIKRNTVGRPRLDASPSQDPKLVKKRMAMRVYTNKKNKEIINAIDDGEECDDNLIDAKKQIVELKSDKKELLKLLKEADKQLLSTVGSRAIIKKKLSKETILKNYKNKFGNNMDKLNEAVEEYKTKKNLVK